MQADDEEASMLANLRSAFEKRARTRSFTYELRGGASDAEIASAEERLGLRFPPQVRALYAGFDGLKVEPPALEIFSVVRLERDPETLHLAFAKVYGVHTVCFETGALNDAAQWNIIFARTGQVITRSIASFLTNKLWGYLDSDGTEWLEEVLVLQELGPLPADSAWVFSKADSGYPSGVFATRAAAESWIAAHRLSGTLTECPIGCGALEYAIRNGRFCPKSSSEIAPEFIARFSGALDHCHYQTGERR